jgi:hypothetical protein
MKYFEKIGKDTSLIKDFMAGVEPTGVYTFENATKNIKSHTKHKIIGDVGGFVGGSAISAALGALGTIGLGKTLSKKHPVISKLVTMAGKDQFLFFKPRKAIKALKNLPAAMTQISKEQKLVKDIKSAYKTKSIKAINLSEKERVLRSSEEFTKTYGEDAAGIARKGAAVLGIGGTSVLGGGLNALSAHTQYDTALKLKKTR